MNQNQESSPLLLCGGQAAKKDERPIPQGREDERPSPKRREGSEPRKRMGEADGRH